MDHINNQPKEIAVVGAGTILLLITRLCIDQGLFFSGVMGLTTAVKIQERGGYHVTLVAETFPSDPKTIRYTSLWAVGQGIPVFSTYHEALPYRVPTMSVTQKVTQSNRVRVFRIASPSNPTLNFIAEIDEETFKVMWNLSAPGGEAEGCFLRLHQTDYFYDGRDVHLDWMPDVGPIYTVHRSPKLTRRHSTRYSLLICS